MNYGWYLLAICICHEEPISIEAAEALFYENKTYEKRNGRGGIQNVEFNKKLLEAKESGLTYAEVAKMFNVTFHTVKNRVIRMRGSAGNVSVQN